MPGSIDKIVHAQFGAGPSREGDHQGQCWPTRRAPIHRMVEIHGRLNAAVKFPANQRAPINCCTLAADFGCDPKTVQRDIDFMRYTLALPIIYDAVKRSFYYVASVGSFVAQVHRADVGQLQEAA